ncbi:Hypothetical protein CM240_2049 [Clostridium bornimense]|uniref:VanZ-like domain-containing protein n=2 Tax=Clostridium bornimense TaxID=1216932 RepID=W6S4D9_9CLOT|nr:Hypothetical protein CM240_2049 [Clostridium bornimense]
MIIICITIVGFIFYNSSQTGDSSNDRSRGVMQKIIESDYISSSFDGVNKDKLNKLFRKCAHVAEYCLLAFVLGIVFQVLKVNNGKYIIHILFAILLIAVLDEFYQMYIPGRNSNVLDVLIDFSGGVIGITIFSIIKKIIFLLCRGFRRNGNKKIRSLRK